MAQDQDKKKLHSDEDKERRAAEENPRHRGVGDFGTHGGPNKGKKSDDRALHGPGISKAGTPD